MYFLFKSNLNTDLSVKKIKIMFKKNQIIRIKISSYDHEVLDLAIKKIIQVGTKSGSIIKGPIPLPTKKEIFTVLKATHKYKDSREQFERRTHKRLLDFINPKPSVINDLQILKLPGSVNIEIKVV